MTTSDPIKANVLVAIALCPQFISSAQVFVLRNLPEAQVEHFLGPSPTQLTQLESQSLHI
jgi:hypothetical protein